MRFRDLTETFARLEATSSRLESTRILADLLSRAELDDLEPIVNLTLGRLRPPHEGIEVGIAEKTLVSILARAYGKTEEIVTRRLRRTGDLGSVAEALAPEDPQTTLSVREVHARLLEVAATAGKGSAARKAALMARLLQQTSPIEAKYLVRIVQGRLRLGVGDVTVLESAALGALGDRAKKDLLEQAYNVRADLGSIVRLAYADGEEAIRAVGPQVGVPVRPALAQRLGSTSEIIAKLGQVLAEPKYDGFRLQLHRDGDRVWAFSRRLEDVSEMFPDITLGLERQLKTRRAILEGEAIVYNPETGEFLPFQVTMTRKRKYRIEETAQRYPLRCFVFELLYAEGTNYIPRPLIERKKRLRRLLPFRPDDPLAVAEDLVTRSPEELQNFFDDMIHRGLEGIVAKRPDATYHAGARLYNWVKLKRTYEAKLGDTVDVVLVGYQVGRGKRAAFGIGSLLGAVYDPEQDRFRTVAKIGSGPTDEQWAELKAMLDEQATKTRPPRVDSLIEPDVWIEPKHVIAVLADEVTRSPFHTCGKVGKAPGYALRFPRTVGGIRTDKGPEDATTETEILEMYRRQMGLPRAEKERARPAAEHHERAAASRARRERRRAA